MTDWQSISEAIGAATDRPFRIARQDAASGGCINQTWRIEGQDGRQYFVKLNAASKLAMFVAEAAGLLKLAATQTIRVPQPVAYGSTKTHSFLALEYLELKPHGNTRLLGERLAALHCSAASSFGFTRDNFIGSTPQPNNPNNDWVNFWREQRLGFQLRLAAQNGLSGSLQVLGDALLEKLPDFFRGYSPRPALLHGDLWGGNHAFLADGTPVIFDPAPYYGDPECDLAMTELFGGYSADFYAAYRAAPTLDAGYAARRNLYNLYHVLNHANLFGGSYAKQAERMMRELLAA